MVVEVLCVVADDVLVDFEAALGGGRADFDGDEVAVKSGGTVRTEYCLTFITVENVLTSMH